MGPRYVSKLLFSESHKIAYKSVTTEAREKILRILEFFLCTFDCIMTAIKFYLLNLATDF
jgi:hypothetical protein